MGDLNVEEQDMQQESSEHSVWAQYQECVLGAFGVLFVDKAARERFIELDPTLSILVRMCRGDVDPGESARIARTDGWYGGVRAWVAANARVGG